MLIIAIVVGYILGVAPFLWLEYKDKYLQKEEAKTENDERKNDMLEIIDEYLNGTKETETIKENENVQDEIQYDIYKEFVTGNTSFIKKGVE